MGSDVDALPPEPLCAPILGLTGVLDADIASEDGEVFTNARALGYHRGGQGDSVDSIGFIAMTTIYFLYRSSVPEYLNVGAHRHEQEAVCKKMTEKMISPRAHTLFTN